MKAGGKLLVFFHRDFLSVPDPLPAFEQGVEAVGSRRNLNGRLPLGGEIDEVLKEGRVVDLSVALGPARLTSNL